MDKKHTRVIFYIIAHKKKFKNSRKQRPYNFNPDHFSNKKKNLLASRAYS